jgi:hypothetical protein
MADKGKLEEAAKARAEIEAALNKILSQVDRKYHDAARSTVLATVDRAVAW